MITEMEFYGKRGCTNAFEALDYTTKERLNAVVSKISIPELQQFVVTILTRNVPDTTTFEDSVGVAEMMVDYLTARHLYTPLAPNKAADVLLAASLLHNVYYDRDYCNADTDWQEVYTLRKEFTNLAKELVQSGCGAVDMGAFEYTFALVEAQLGEDMPVPGSRPVRGQTSQDMWEVLWFYYTFAKDAADVDLPVGDYKAATEVA